MEIEKLALNKTEMKAVKGDNFAFKIVAERLNGKRKSNNKHKKFKIIESARSHYKALKTEEERKDFITQRFTKKPKQRNKYASPKLTKELKQIKINAELFGDAYDKEMWEYVIRKEYGNR